MAYFKVLCKYIQDYYPKNKKENIIHTVKNFEITSKSAK